MTSYLYMDAETIPTDSQVAKDRIAANIKPPGNIKKADSIAKWHAEEGPAAIGEAISKTALNGSYGRICSLAWAFDDETVEHLSWPDKVKSEKDLLLAFRDDIERYVNHGTIVVAGHNIIKFDLRFIFQRAIINGVKFPHWWPTQARSWSHEVNDTMVMWCGDREYISQDELCFALGIESEEDIDGSMVGKLWSEGKYDLIAKHNILDVEKVRKIHRKMRFING